MTRERKRAADLYRDRLHRNDTGRARRWNSEPLTAAQSNKLHNPPLARERVKVTDNVCCDVCGRKLPRAAATRIGGIGFMCPPGDKDCKPDWRVALSNFKAQLNEPAPVPVVVVPWWRKLMWWRNSGQH